MNVTQVGIALTRCQDYASPRRPEWSLAWLPKILAVRGPVIVEWWSETKAFVSEKRQDRQGRRHAVEKPQAE